VQWSWIAATLAFACMYASARHFGHVMLALLTALPGNPAIPSNRISWPRVWAGMVLEKMLSLAGLAVTMFKADITWSGVRYWKSGGRTVRVQHCHAL
jgi:hypothetical protein